MGVGERVTIRLRRLVKDEVRTGLRTAPLPWYEMALPGHA